MSDAVDIKATVEVNRKTGITRITSKDSTLPNPLNIVVPSDSKSERSIHKALGYKPEGQFEIGLDPSGESVFLGFSKTGHVIVQHAGLLDHLLSQIEPDAIITDALAAMRIQDERYDSDSRSPISGERHVYLVVDLSETHTPTGAVIDKVRWPALCQVVRGGRAANVHFIGYNAPVQWSLPDLLRSNCSVLDVDDQNGDLTINGNSRGKAIVSERAKWEGRWRTLMPTRGADNGRFALGVRPDGSKVVVDLVAGLPGALVVDDPAHFAYIMNQVGYSSVLTDLDAAAELVDARRGRPREIWTGKVLILDMSKYATRRRTTTDADLDALAKIEKVIRSGASRGVYVVGYFPGESTSAHVTSDVQDLFIHSTVEGGSSHIGGGRHVTKWMAWTPSVIEGVTDFPA